MKKSVLVSLVFALTFNGFSQLTTSKWSKTNQYIFELKDGNIVSKEVKTDVVKNVLPKSALPKITITKFDLSKDENVVIFNTNAEKVWRYETRADFYVYDIKNKTTQQLGAGLPKSSLMFAKLSPDGKYAAYVNYFNHNIYVEELATKKIKQLTKDGSRKLINGTFDWVYEEEFSARDGFRWSDDSKKIAFWQIDARQIRDFYMINNTDSIYSKVIPVEYPKVGEDPSPCKVGVVDITTEKTTWMQVPGDARQHYIPVMEWTKNNNNIILQQLNRKQNTSKLYVCDITNGQAKNIYTETDKAWIDCKTAWDLGEGTGWIWLENGKKFLWISEKNGWRQAFVINNDGTGEKLITNANFDIIKLKGVDENNGLIYYLASPDNATQKYLYKAKLDGTGTPERLTPSNVIGSCEYSFNPNYTYANYSFSNNETMQNGGLIEMPSHKGIEKIKFQNYKMGVTFFKVKNSENVEMDAWMIKPYNFDENKKYPVVFYVYGEPGATTVSDEFGTAYNYLYQGNMAKEGYIQISIDNRGTPAPKGSTWRKSIYGKIGQLNIKDQADAAKEILKWPFVDKDRIAVWGWSGGGSSTLNLMLQYPNIYKVGVAIAPVTNLLAYDNIYEERYMGVIPESLADYKKGSPINYVKNLKGKLLYIHGTGDDNVHFQNAEMFLNEIIKEGKIINYFTYPNRTHNINEGEGTFEHLQKLYTNFIKENCPGGAK